MVGPTLNSLAEQTGVSLSAVGLVLTTRSLGYLFGAMGSGRWIDRTSAHRTLGLTLAIAAACVAAVPFAGSLPVLLVIMAILGWTLGGMDVAGNALVLKVYKNQAAPYINGLHFFFGLGGLGAPFVVAGAMRLTGTIGWAYWALAIVPIPFAAILLRRPMREEDESERVPGVSRNTKLTVGFMVAASIYLFYVGAQIGLVSWLFVFVEEYTDAQVATHVMGGFWAAFSLFRLLGVLFSRRWTSRQILVADFTVAIAAAIPLMIWPSVRSALWIGSLALGAAHASIYATVIMLLGEHTPLSGRQMSAITVSACGGSMLFPWLMGRLLPVFGPLVVPGLSTALMVIAFAVTLAVMRRRAGNRHRQESGPRVISEPS